MIHYYLTHCPTKTLTLTHPLIHHIHSFTGDNRYAQSHLWPELIGGEMLLFLWAVEVSFPHPNSLLARQLVEQGRGRDGKSRSPQENNNGEDRNEDDVDCGDDEEDNEGNDHIMPDEADYDDDEIDDGSGLEVGVKLGAGAFVRVNRGLQPQPQQLSPSSSEDGSDTSYHADAEKVTSILPISPPEGASPTAQTVFRSVGGLGKEHVTVSIAEPLYFELFRCCHQEEWNQRNINSNNNNSNNHNGNNNNNNNNNNGSGSNSDNSINTHSPLPS